MGEELSEPIQIDHTQPRLVGVVREGKTFRVQAADASSPLRDAVYSVDSGDWRPVRPADGILDGREETLLLEAPTDALLVLLRLTDAAHNVVTFNLGREAQ